MPDTPPKTAAPPRRKRADAQRNHERLLAEAEMVFKEQGTNASLEKVARGAGVAIGTLYAHFPGRRALLSALLRDRQATVFALGDALVAEADADGAAEADRGATPPLEALVQWMHAVAEHGATYSGLAAELLGSLSDDTSELHAACGRMAATGRDLVDHAHTAGVIRADATVDDVFALISAASWLRGQLTDPHQTARVLDTLFDGLRP